MSHSRVDEIYDGLSNLRQLLGNYDGSRTFGSVTPDMEVEYDKISKEIRLLETELEKLGIS